MHTKNCNEEGNKEEAEMLQKQQEASVYKKLN
jgi:hypothetical protein